MQCPSYGLDALATRAELSSAKIAKIRSTGGLPLASLRALPYNGAVPSPYGAMESALNLPAF